MAARVKCVTVRERYSESTLVLPLSVADPLDICACLTELTHNSQQIEKGISSTFGICQNKNQKRSTASKRSLGFSGEVEREREKKERKKSENGHETWCVSRRPQPRIAKQLLCRKCPSSLNSYEHNLSRIDSNSRFEKMVKGNNIWKWRCVRVSGYNPAGLKLDRWRFLQRRIEIKHCEYEGVISCSVESEPAWLKNNSGKARVMLRRKDENKLQVCR